MSAKNPILTQKWSLAEALGHYQRARELAREFGGIELSCPTCKEPTAVEDIGECDLCSRYTCPGCFHIGEDVSFCDECFKGATKESA